MRKMVADAGLQDRIIIDSAGTADWHTGKRPDERMRRHAKQRGYQLDSYARHVKASDMAEFDVVLAMDEANRAYLLQLCDSTEQKAKVKLFCDYAQNREEVEVPDPYYGGAEGFEQVLDIIQDGCTGLIAHACRELNIANG
jgi:protein-tyrosine phosphatase